LAIGVLAPTPAPTFTPAPTATPPIPAPCPASLQGAIDATPTGGTLALGACTFHEAVTVSRAMTISGPAVIDGDGVRSAWMTVTGSGVTVDGLTMRNAAAGAAQSGSLSVGAVSGFTLRNATLAGGSYADLRLWQGSGYRVESSDIASGRALGIIGWQVADTLITGSRVHGNNTAGFDPGYEAGGIKLGSATRATVSGNEVDGNAGPGIWCDVSCTAFTVSANRVHDNTHQGILFEISQGASITGNAVWENGWAFTSWGWGGGIVVSSSGGADVSGNTVAWNADGIVVISQSRSGAPAVTGNHVHDNVVAIAPQPGDGSDKMAVAWLQDWSGSLFVAASNNTGSGNDYWGSVAEPQWARFDWNGAISTLSSFNATPGEEGAAYLTTSGLSQALVNAGVPTSAKAH
jgi:nitrous oxidase accessory protein NosD